MAYIIEVYSPVSSDLSTPPPPQLLGIFYIIKKIIIKKSADNTDGSRVEMTGTARVKENVI